MESSVISSDRSLAERRFYSGMAIAIFLSVLVGFARSFFLRPLFPEHLSPSEPVFYVHGVAFTMWIVLFVAQVVFISRRRTDLHKTVGPWAGVLVAVMVVLGVYGALTAASRGFLGLPVPPLQFLAVPMFDMIVFPAFIIIAFIKRHEAQSHKRWMLLATLNLITAAIARWPLLEGLGPLAFFGITDLFIVALAVWDLRSRGKLHRVTVIGGLLMIISQPLRIIISGTAAWLAFATWATGLLK